MFKFKGEVMGADFMKSGALVYLSFYMSENFEILTQSRKHTRQ